MTISAAIDCPFFSNPVIRSHFSEFSPKFISKPTSEFAALR